MQRPIDPQTALIFTMVLISAAEGEMTDAELEMIGRQVRYLPVFRGFDHQRLTEVGRDCADLLRREDGLDLVAELEVLELLRRCLNVDRLVAAAIQRATYARYATL
jgi:hypothetical protein